MKSFDFHRPPTLTAAVALLRSSAAGHCLAGGQSLLPGLKLGRSSASDLVSLALLAELRGIELDGTALQVGASTTHAELAEAPAARQRLPALAALAGVIGDPAVRNRGTLGGAVAFAAPNGDYPAALLALGATVLTDRNARSADGFFAGPCQTSLERDEIITAIRFPLPRRAGFGRFRRATGSGALVTVVVADFGASVRVGVSGAAQVAFRWTEAERALERAFTPAALNGLDVDASRLLSDVHASAEYRAHLVPIMSQRAVSSAH